MLIKACVSTEIKYMLFYSFYLYYSRALTVVINFYKINLCLTACLEGI